jgi:hypothetical protein
MCVVGGILGFVACQPPPVRRPPPEMSGSSLLLDVSPAGRPAMVGAYDFKLLDAVHGKTCVSRGNRSSVYWVGLQDLAQMHSDRLTQQAIAAAAFDAISRLHRADTLVITRVVAEGQGSDRVCATVHGRGVRLIKEGDTTEPESEPDPPKRDSDDLQ